MQVAFLVQSGQILGNKDLISPVAIAVSQLESVERLASRGLSANNKEPASPALIAEKVTLLIEFANFD